MSEAGGNFPPLATAGPLAEAGTRAGRRHFRVDAFNLAALLGDSLMALAGLMIGFWLRFRSGWMPTRWIGVDTDPTQIDLDDYYRLIAIGVVFLIATFMYLRLYVARNLLSMRRVAFVVLKGTSFWLFAYLGLSGALKFEPSISRGYVLCSFVSVLVVIAVWRLIFHCFTRAGALAEGLRQQIVFVGWNSETQRMAQALLGDATQPYRVTGCVPSPSGRYQDEPPPYIHRLGLYEKLSTLIRLHRVDVIVLADLEADMEQVVELSNFCEREMIQFKVIPSYFQILVSGLELETISDVPIMGVSELPLDRLPNRLLKRAVDIVGSVVGLTLSAPAIAIAGAIVYWQSPGPIFYRQVRTGRNGRDFKIIKIRSMGLDAEKTGAQWAKKNDPRRLRIGAFLREWNLDEVPQFWNVLTGEMSLVGPRPERPELIANFKHQVPHYNARHSCKPGITGWAQVNGLRGDTSLVERVRFDLWYLENWSLWLDLQIMLQTFFKRDNAY